MLQIVILMLMGILVGIISAILGLGGGVFIVPALTAFFHLPMREAVGASLVCIIATSAGVAATSTPTNKADVPLALRLEIATTAGAVVGSTLAGILPGNVLSVLFSIVVFASAIYLLVKPQSPDGEEDLENYKPRHWGEGLSVASLAGAISGLVGVGGGFIKVPVMYALMDVPLRVATATSAFMVGITAAASVFVYYTRGDIYPMVAVPTALGVFVGAMVGVHVAHRLRVSWIRIALMLLLVFVGVKMLLGGLGIHVL